MYDSSGEPVGRLTGVDDSLLAGVYVGAG